MSETRVEAGERHGVVLIQDLYLLFPRARSRGGRGSPPSLGASSRRLRGRHSRSVGCENLAQKQRDSKPSKRVFVFEALPQRGAGELVEVGGRAGAHRARRGTRGCLYHPAHGAGTLALLLRCLLGRSAAASRDTARTSTRQTRENAPTATATPTIRLRFERRDARSASRVACSGCAACAETHTDTASLPRPIRSRTAPVPRTRRSARSGATRVVGGTRRSLPEGTVSRRAARATQRRDRLAAPSRRVSLRTPTRTSEAWGWGPSVEPRFSRWRPCRLGRAVRGFGRRASSLRRFALARGLAGGGRRLGRNLVRIRRGERGEHEHEIRGTRGEDDVSVFGRQSRGKIASARIFVPVESVEVPQERRRRGCRAREGFEITAPRCRILSDQRSRVGHFRADLALPLRSCGALEKRVRPVRDGACFPRESTLPL